MFFMLKIKSPLDGIIWEEMIIPKSHLHKDSVNLLTDSSSWQ